MQSSTANRALPQWVFAALCALSLALWFRPLYETLSLSLEDEKYTHILLILPISVALMLTQWTSREIEFRPNIGSGGLLLLSLVAAALARWSNITPASDLRLALSMLALVIWWIASFALCFGARLSRSLIFPLTYLLWIVPLPTVVLSPLIAGLQHGSAIAGEALFWMARTPVSRHGLVLSIPGLDLEVAPECSSIRSSLILIVITMTLAQILLRSPWRKLLVIAVAIPLSIAKNGLRIFTIGWLGTKVDEGFLDGRLHHHGGVIFLAIALAGIFLLLWILRPRDQAARLTIQV